MRMKINKRKKKSRLLYAFKKISKKKTFKVRKIEQQCIAQVK